MKKISPVLGICTALLLAGLMLVPEHSDNPSHAFYAEIAYFMQTNNGRVPKARQRPNDWFYIQRAWPDLDISQTARVKALDHARVRARRAAANKSANVVTWTQAGPTNIPGRIPDIAVHPSQPNTIYAATAAGGLFKSVDLGASWSPIFDAVGPQSIGAVAVHPTNPDIIYVGTGEANAANDTYDGTGIYKSTDGGATWSNIGLPNSYRIGRILIDTLRPDSVYVAVTGKLFGTNPERGVYRTPDGGQSWEQLLSVNDSTGCIDIVMNPQSGLIYAAMWERWRNPRERRVGGLASGIHRSQDWGATWSLLGPGGAPGIGLPAPADTVGRIGLTLDAASGNVYAIYYNHPGYFMGVYKSLGNGLIWTRVTDNALTNSFASFGWYFGQVRLAPGGQTLYALNVPLMKSTDGGNSWSDRSLGIHVDHHALCVLPTNPDVLYQGCDGGVHYSDNGGASWTQLANMPNTQFYAITIDPNNPDRLGGGTQDNGTLLTGGGGPAAWSVIHGGDGFYLVISHADPAHIFAEYQWGWLERSTDGGSSWLYAMGGIDYNNERHNWNTPVVMDPQNAQVLYYGSNLLYKTTNAAVGWTAISGDLTNGSDPGNLTFGTITTIGVSPVDPQVVYVGTDDANVWVTQNGGGNWTSINAGLPVRWVTRVTSDPHDSGTAYVTFSGYKAGSYLPHIFRTTDYGQNWSDITGDLFGTPVNDIIVDPQIDSTLYIATDFGVYWTENLGSHWEPLGTGMPISPVHDIDYHDGARRLAAGTHGRSMFVTTLANACTCDCHADPQCDGVANVLDVVLAVNVAFRGAAPVIDPSGSCPYESTDADCSGATNVLDVVRFVNVAFRNGDPLVEFCNPCP